MKAIRTDITKINAYCIVNAANNTLLGGGGVDGAIHRAAGPELIEYCRTLNGCETGEAKITPGFNLMAHYIIHTAGPIYSGNDEKDSKLLKNCYINCLNLAKENTCYEIVFPAISCGIYGYPIDKATKIAIKTVKKWLKQNKNYNINVMFSCFEEDVYNEYCKYIKRGE